MTTETRPAFTYADTDWPIRETTIAAHRMSWDLIARPGRWWSGTERVAIAAVTRAAAEYQPAPGGHAAARGGDPRGPEARGRQRQSLW